MKLLHFKRAGEKKKDNQVAALKINIKPRTPGAFPMMHCGLLSMLTRDVVAEAGAEVYLSQTISVMGTRRYGEWE